MHTLKEMLEKEYRWLRSIQLIVDERLAKAPEGTLMVTTSNKNLQFVQCLDSGRKRNYIKKDDRVVAASLAQKAYDQRVKKLVDRRIKQIETLAKEYKDNEIDKLYGTLSATRRELIQPVKKPWEQCLAEWKSIPYVGKEFDESIPVIYSKKGERVRSKSEKIIADTFYELGIEYKYECPLTLKGYGIVHPDFTILRKKRWKRSLLGT